MKANRAPIARFGLVLCGALAIAATGCRTHVVHQHTRTVYVPAPPVVVHPPPAPTPAPPPAVVVTPAPVVVAPPPAPAPVVVVSAPAPAPVVVIQAESDFYEPLGAHGRWVVVGSHGRCWIPARVEAGWRPYCNGYWQRTDAGWYWMSDEPWGWATYHYGRWDWRTDLGWFWVPHTQWSPAWVCWREGAGYVGWAPLRPSMSIGVSHAAVNYEPAFASHAFVFVEHRRMLEPVRPKTVIVNNTTIINQTVNITKIHEVNKTVVIEGPRPEVIERESGRKVQAVPVREVRHREETTVAARERNLPSARGSRTPPTVQHDPKPAVATTPVQTPAPAVREVRTSERVPATVNSADVVQQPARPMARPTPPPAAAATRSQPALTEPRVTPPAREERKPEVANPKSAVTPHATPVQTPAPATTAREVRTAEQTPAPVKQAEVMLQPARPATRPAPVVARPQPAPAQPPANQPAPAERKPTPASPKQVTPSAVTPLTNVAKTVPTPATEGLRQREVRPSPRPAVVTNPATVRASADSTQHDVRSKAIVAPGAANPRPGGEARTEATRGTRPPGKIAPASPATNTPTVPAPAAQSKRPAPSRGDTARSAELIETNQPSNDATPPKAANERETTSRAARPTRQPR